MAESRGTIRLAKGAIASVLCSGALIAIPSHAGAAGPVTVGIEPSPGGAPSFIACGNPCAGATLTGEVAASYQSPMDGAIVNYRLAQDGGWDGVALTVMRPQGGASYDLVGQSSPTDLGPDPGVASIDVNLQIKKGDFFGIAATSGDGGYIPTGESGPFEMTTYAFSLADPFPQTLGSAFTDANQQLWAAADIEPDADLDGYGDLTRDECNKQRGALLQPCNEFSLRRKRGNRLVARVAGKGTLRYGAANDRRVRSAVAARRRPLLRRGSERRRRTAPGRIAVTARANRAGRRLLRRAGSAVFVRAKAIWKPAGGKPATKRVLVRLKR